MDPVADALQKQGFLILDGAMATELEFRGAELNHKLWSAKILYQQPELIRQVHLDYFLAGADVATTASYQATLAGFEAAGFSPETSIGMMLKSVELACEARDQFWSEQKNREGRIRPIVAASIGPYGAYLANGAEYTGQYDLSHDQLLDFHFQRMQLLAQSEADLLAFETIPCLLEARVLVELLKHFPDKKAWLSFSCGNNREISSREPFETAVSIANSSDQIVAVGVNCTAPVFIADLLELASANTDLPLLAYPNSGETWDADRHCWVGDNKLADLVQQANLWYKAGAKLIGGCCRTTPSYINHLRAAIEADQQ